MSQPGQIRIAMAGATPITTSGAILSIAFAITGDIGTITTLDIVRASLNEGAIPMVLSDGSLAVFNRGDANGDGVINVLDITKVARLILEFDPLPKAYPPYFWLPADCNGNGFINILDISRIAGKILGLD